MLLERVVASRLHQAGALLCVCSGSMVVALMLSSLMSFALVSTVSLHPPSHSGSMVVALMLSSLISFALVSTVSLHPPSHM